RLGPRAGLVKSWSCTSCALIPVSLRRFPPLAKGVFIFPPCEGCFHSPPLQGGERDRSLAPSFDRAHQKHASRNRPSSTVNTNLSPAQPRAGGRNRRAGSGHDWPRG